MSEELKCGQQTCNEPATCQLFWPSEPPLPSCDLCAKKAKNISAAMGFYLHIEPILPVEP